MIRSKTFMAVFGALCASAVLAAVSELLTWLLHLSNLAAELFWVLACVLMGSTSVLNKRLRQFELLRIGGTVLVATAAWQIVKWAIVLLEGTTQIAGLSYQLALGVRIAVEVLILGLVVIVAVRMRQVAQPTDASR